MKVTKIWKAKLFKYLFW